MSIGSFLQLIATLCAAILAGAALYINVVEHPARMSCGAEAALNEWAPSYQRATWMQAPLALERWNRLHAVRTTLGLAALVVFLLAGCQ